MPIPNRVDAPHTVEVKVPEPVRRYVLFESWAPSPGRRAQWPTWRRMVRPVGATAWWLTGALGVITGASGRAAFFGYYGVFSILTVFYLGCVAFGFVDAVRWRRAHRANVRIPSTTR